VGWIGGDGVKTDRPRFERGGLFITITDWEIATSLVRVAGGDGQQQAAESHGYRTRGNARVGGRIYRDPRYGNVGPEKPTGKPRI